MRDLASIVTIETKNKLYQKDKICVVTFKENAYEAIVPVGYNIGDKMVFIQEGSILPVLPKWEYLRKRCYREALNGFLISPMTMGVKDNNGEKGDKVKSWGLCISLEEAEIDSSIPAGTDVTDLLKIKKYEPDLINTSPVKENKPKFIQFCFNHKLLRWVGKLWLKSKIKASEYVSFPTSIISKSDETTIQNCKEVMEQFKGKMTFVTVKMEGQSFTCSLDLKSKKFYICSRNNRFKKKDKNSEIFYNVAERYDIENKLKDYYKKHKVLLVIQGEQVGPNIQGNIYNLKENDWFVFRMKAYYGKEWFELCYEEMSIVCNSLGLKAVPLISKVIDMGKSFPTVDSLVEYAEKQYWVPNNYLYEPKEGEKLWQDYLQHEGIVIKSIDYNKEENTGFSFKVKNMQYQEKGYADIHNIAEKLLEK